MQELFDVGTSRHVAKMLLSKEKFQKESATALDRVLYRFFTIPKKVRLLAYQMWFERKGAPDDWMKIFLEGLKLKDQKKVCFKCLYVFECTFHCLRALYTLMMWDLYAGALYPALQSRGGRRER